MVPEGVAKHRPRSRLPHQPKLRGIKTNAQPAPATSPCRSAHLLFVFLGEEMVGCHVSVSSHVMPLPALVHSFGHNLPLTFGGSSQAQRANSEGPWESLAHPAHWFLAAKQARQAHLQVWGEVSGLPEPLQCQPPSLFPPTAQELVRRYQTKRWSILLILTG